MQSLRQNAGGALLSASIAILATLFVGLKKEPGHDSKYHRDSEIRWYTGAANSLTANGEEFNPKNFTYASYVDKFNTWVEITYNKNVIWARCNDRGPNRVELTPAAFEQLAPLDEGVIRGAKIKYLNTHDN